MLLIDEFWAIIALIIAVVIYVVITAADPPTNWGSAPEAIQSMRIMQVVRGAGCGVPACVRARVFALCLSLDAAELLTRNGIMVRVGKLLVVRNGTDAAPDENVALAHQNFPTSHSGDLQPRGQELCREQGTNALRIHAPEGFWHYHAGCCPGIAVLHLLIGVVTSLYCAVVQARVAVSSPLVCFFGIRP